MNNQPYANPDALVSTEWLAAHLNDPNIRIVESNEDPLLYSTGHIPGAVNIDWVADLNDPLTRDYLDAPTASATTPPSFFMATKITGGRAMPFGCFNCLGTAMPKC